LAAVSVGLPLVSGGHKAKAIAADRVAPDKAGFRTGFPPQPFTCGSALAEARMPIPEPRCLLLCEAVRRVADRCSISIKEAQTALDRAFREHSLVPFDSQGNRITEWECLAIDDWDKNLLRRGGRHVTYPIEWVGLSREALDGWIDLACRPVCDGGHEALRQTFVNWMKAEKKRVGSYPPRDPPKHSGQRPTWRVWGRSTAFLAIL
jgi:hypothetical protein